MNAKDVAWMLSSIAGSAVSYSVISHLDRDTVTNSFNDNNIIENAGNYVMGVAAGIGTIVVLAAYADNIIDVLSEIK